MNEILTNFLDLISSIDPVWRTVLSGVGMFLETSVLIGLIVPGDSMVLISSTAVTTNVEHVFLVIAVIIGSLGGESLGFWLGRHFGPAIRASRLGRWLGEANWVKAERYLDRRGGIAVFLSRFLPVLHSLIPLTVGMSRMSYRRFITWTVPACVIWAVAYVSAGRAAAVTFRELSSSLHQAGYLFVGIIVVFVVLVWAIKKLISRKEARHLEAAPEELSDAATTTASTEASSAPSQSGTETGLPKERG